MAQTHHSHAMDPAGAAHADGVSSIAVDGQEAATGLAGSPLAIQGFFLGWITIGIISALWLAPRGHDRRILAALGVGLGPLMVFAVANMVRNTDREARPVVLRPGDHHGGPLDVMVIVGDPNAITTLTPSLDAVRDDVGQFILGRTVPFEWAHDDLDNDVIEDAFQRLMAADRLLPLRGAQLEVHPGTPAAAARRFCSQRPNQSIVFYAIEEPSSEQPRHRA